MDRIEFRNSRGQRLVGTLHRASAGEKALGPTILLCHGMMSSREGRKQTAFARFLHEKGFSVLRFDFSFCGESEGRFEEITFSQEVDDLESALRWARGHGAEPVGLLGSSMGGAVAVLAASRDPAIRAVVTLAAVGFPARLAERMDDLEALTERWKAEGFVLGAEGKVGPRFFEDARRQDVMEAARRLSAPLLVLHGGEDEVVPVEDARALHANAGGPKELRILPGVDHRFTRPGALREILEAAGDWFEHYMGRSGTPGPEAPGGSGKGP